LLANTTALPQIFFTGAHRQNSFTSPDDVCLVSLATQLHLQINKDHTVTTDMPGKATTTNGEN